MKHQLLQSVLPLFNQYTEDASSGPVISPLDSSTLHLIRKWKNKHRSRFFTQEIITTDMQLLWWSAYSEDPFTLVTLISDGSTIIGTIGIRLLTIANYPVVDIFNVIRGCTTPTSKGFMSISLRQICCSITKLTPLPVVISVLNDNPAKLWYLRNGFIPVLPYHPFTLLRYVSL